MTARMENHKGVSGTIAPSITNNARKESLNVSRESRPGAKTLC